MNICENCCDKSACEQIEHECPLITPDGYLFINKKGIAYKFNNAKGEEFIGYSNSYEEAKEFAYRAGLCCLGRI